MLLSHEGHRPVCETCVTTASKLRLNLNKLLGLQYFAGKMLGKTAIILDIEMLLFVSPNCFLHSVKKYKYSYFVYTGKNVKFLVDKFYFKYNYIVDFIL